MACIAVSLLALMAGGARSFRAGDVTRGPLTVISSPDPLAGCKHTHVWTNGTPNTEAETHLVVNPTNPNNIVAIWIAHDFSGDVVSVTFDGGTTWQNVAIPGISLCDGGIYANGTDPWISFAPNGDLYTACLGVAGPVPNAVYVSKSTDGGLTWSSPLAVSGADEADRPTLTAEPGNAKYAYAVWNQGIFGGPASTQFSRTTDGGATWEPNRAIYTPPAGNAVWAQEINVLPDGTLVCVFTELILTGYNKSVPQYNYALSVQRSTDKGKTWSAPIQVAAQMPRNDPNPKDFPWWATVTDPNNGHGIVAAGMGHSVAMNPRNGSLYAVWIDARFSGGQYNSIAFSQSTDGGLTWSKPIPVNQTPNTLPALNQQAWHPTVAVAADGTIGVSYYDLRFEASGHGCTTDYWLARCTPTTPQSSTDPANWGNEIRLTDESFDTEDTPTVAFGGSAAYWLGDYNWLATVGNSFVAVWAQPFAGSPDHILFRKVGP